MIALPTVSEIDPSGLCSGGVKVLDLDLETATVIVSACVGALGQPAIQRRYVRLATIPKGNGFDAEGFRAELAGYLDGREDWTFSDWTEAHGEQSPDPGDWWDPDADSL